MAWPDWPGAGTDAELVEPGQQRVRRAAVGGGADPETAGSLRQHPAIVKTPDRALSQDPPTRIPKRQICA